MKQLLMAICAVALASPAYAQSAAPFLRSVSVSGEASEHVTPDQAILTATIVNKDPVLGVAKGQNDLQLERVLKLLQQYKIPNNKIQPSGMYVAPEYTYNPKNGEQRLMGYTVSRTLSITMDDVASSENILSALIDAKVSQIGGVEFTLKDREAKTAGVRAKAFANARARAQALADAAGAKLGRAITISTNGNTPYPPPPMPRMKMMAAAAAMEDTSVAPSLPGMVDITETVNVMFELE